MKKKIILIFVFIVVLLLVFICIKRWNVWFGNPVEPPYVGLSEPGRIQLTFGNDGEYSRNISWQCGDSIVPSGVWLVQTDIAGGDTTFVNAEAKKLTSTGGITVIYWASLTDLQAGRYSYSVSTGNRESAWYSFDVHGVDSMDAKCSFIYLGDVQDTVNGVSGDFFTTIRKLHPADFWVFGGDVVERPQDRYWAEYFSSMDSVSQTTPVIAAPGNHEYIKGITRKIEERFVYTFSYLVGSRYKEHSVFKLRYGNVAIITLDSNRDFWTLGSQRRWLKEALESVKDVKWKVVVAHHPIYSIRGKMNNRVVRTMFNGLLKEYNVDLVLQGHEHDYARMTTKTDADILTTPVYVVSQSSPKDYRLYFNPLYDRFGAGERYYQVVEVDADTLKLKTFRENNELYDYLHIEKTNSYIKIVDLAANIPEHIEFNTRTGKMGKDKTGANYRLEIKEWSSRKKQ